MIICLCMTGCVSKSVQPAEGQEPTTRTPIPARLEQAKETAPQFIAAFDRDGDSELDAVELTPAFANMNKTLKEHPPKGSWEIRQLKLGRAPEKWSDMWMQRYDRNNDGKLDVKEVALGLALLAEHQRSFLRLTGVAGPSRSVEAGEGKR